MSENKTVTVSFPWLIPSLVIIFVLAKLTGHFDYSWWWVFSPLWIPAGIVLGLYLIYMVIALTLMVIFGIVIVIQDRNFEYFSKKNRLKRKNARKASTALENYARVLRMNRRN